jgi:hypothetical protein
MQLRGKLGTGRQLLLATALHIVLWFYRQTEFYWRQNCTGIAWLTAFAVSFVPQCLVAPFFVTPPRVAAKYDPSIPRLETISISPSLLLSSILSFSLPILCVLTVPCLLLSDYFKAGSQHKVHPVPHDCLSLRAERHGVSGYPPFHSLPVAVQVTAEQ